MSEELFGIMEKTNQKSLELWLAFQCAPVLTGIKTANLLIVEEAITEEISSILKEEGIFSFLLFKMKDRLIYLIYKEEKLLEYIGKKEVSVLLGLFEYRSRELLDILEAVSAKYREYMNGNGEFPHELGLLLGYPVADVIGFVDYQGRNFLYEGYWKVYENPEYARHLFETYDKVRERAVMAIYQGNSIKNIIL